MERGCKAKIIEELEQRVVGKREKIVGEMGAHRGSKRRKKRGAGG